jgi:hypothetical protein
MTLVKRLALCLLLVALLTVPVLPASAATSGAAAGIGALQSMLVRITVFLRASMLDGDEPPAATENGHGMDPNG